MSRLVLLSGSGGGGGGVTPVVADFTPFLTNAFTSFGAGKLTITTLGVMEFLDGQLQCPAGVTIDFHGVPFAQLTAPYRPANDGVAGVGMIDNTTAVTITVTTAGVCSLLLGGTNYPNPNIIALNSMRWNTGD